MKTANETRASSTATTPPNAHANNGKPTAPKPGDPAPTHSESAYLAQQAVDAKAAISRVLSDLGTDLGQVVNPGPLMRKHPWLTIAGSVVAGFAASAAIVPSKEQQALRKLAAIERALNPAPPPKKKDEDGDAPADQGAKDYKSGRTSFARTMLGEVIKAVQPTLLSMLTAAISAHAAKPTEAEMQAAAAAEDAGVPPHN